MDLQLLQLDRIVWFWLVGAVAAIVVWGLIRRRKRIHRLIDPAALDRLANAPSIGRTAVRATMIVVALALLGIALLDPRWGYEFREARRRGMDVVFAVDCSRSMLAEDVSPNRLTRAKEYVLETIDRLAGERVALIGFAGVSAVKCPLTLNYGAMRTAVDDLDIMSGARGGSMLGEGLNAIANAFVDDGPQSKVAILLTDGDDQDSAPADVVGRLTEMGARLYVVGLGDTKDGARIPVMRDGQKVFLTDQGQEVWSRMSPEILRPLADATNGAFLPASTHRIDLGGFFSQNIAELSETELEQQSVREAIPRFQWFVGVAFTLLLLEGLLADRTVLRPIRMTHGGGTT